MAALAVEAGGYQAISNLLNPVVGFTPDGKVFDVEDRSPVLGAQIVSQYPFASTM
jgi:hypothetical protein